MTKSGIIPIFDMRGVQNIMVDYINVRVKREIEILTRIGEKFVNDARTNGQYTDRTGNLRSSIGYILINEGNIIRKNFKTSGNGTDKANGLKAAKEFTDKIKSEYSKGLVLIGVAGMEYALYVESKGFDVITGSAPTAQIMENAFKDFLK